MMNTKIIILLSLAAYVSCGLNDSAGRAKDTVDPKLEFLAKYQNLQIVGKSDDEIIEDAFNMCNEWAYPDQSVALKNISIYQFSLYMVKEDEETLKTFKEYAINLGFGESFDQAEGWINLLIFSKVFKHYCSKLKVSVEKFAQERKDAFILRIQNEIIKDVFNDCREWFGRDGQLIIKISDYKFCTYMQNSVDNYDAIMNYITSFDFPQQTIRENWIDFPIFSKVFRGYCNKLGVSVEKFAQERKEATISRRQKEMETIRRDEQFKMSK